VLIQCLTGSSGAGESGEAEPLDLFLQVGQDLVQALVTAGPRTGRANPTYVM
jgi:hypothetical protein